MKHINLILILGILIVFVSCSTSTTFIVHANPGTEILTSERQRLAVADNNGEATIKCSDINYSAFLLSHSPNSEDFIPFALDYRHRNNAGTGILAGLCYTFMGAGGVTYVAGLAMAASDSDNSDAVGIMIPGAAVMALGAAFVPACNRLNQTAYKNEYKYLPNQTTNQNIQITKPTFDK